MPSPTPGFDLSHKRVATVEDVVESMSKQLLILVEWAKFIPVFCDLSLDDQVAPLSHNTSAHNSQVLCRNI